MSYVRFEVSKELADTALEALEIARDTGKIKKGTNEVTKAVERGNAKLVFIGSDITPPEIVMHLPMLCEEKNIPYLFVPRAEIGDSVGIHVPTKAGCIVDIWNIKDKIAEIVAKIDELKK